MVKDRLIGKIAIEITFGSHTILCSPMTLRLSAYLWKGTLILSLSLVNIMNIMAILEYVFNTVNDR